MVWTGADESKWLEAAWLPVIRLSIPDVYHLRAGFFRWEIARASRYWPPPWSARYNRCLTDRLRSVLSQSGR
jgi:hypothetical protein